MTLARILNHVNYVGTERPVEVSAARWRGILRWLTARHYI